MNSEEKYPLQLILRKILLMSQVNFSATNVDPATIAKNQYLSEMLKYGTIIISTLPLMIIYAPASLAAEVMRCYGRIRQGLILA